MKIFKIYLAIIELLRDEWQVLKPFSPQICPMFSFHSWISLLLDHLGIWLCVCFCASCSTRSPIKMTWYWSRALSSDAKAGKTSSSSMCRSWMTSILGQETRNHRLLKLVYSNRRWAGIYSKKYTRFSKTFQLLFLPAIQAHAGLLQASKPPQFSVVDSKHVRTVVLQKPSFDCYSRKPPPFQC